MMKVGNNKKNEKIAFIEQGSPKFSGKAQKKKLREPGEALFDLEIYVGLCGIIRFAFFSRP